MLFYCVRDFTVGHNNETTTKNTSVAQSEQSQGRVQNEGFSSAVSRDWLRQCEMNRSTKTMERKQEKRKQSVTNAGNITNKVD